MKPTISEIKKKIVPILIKNDVKRAAIFGSFARGKATPKSDVDLLIEYAHDDKSLLDLVGLKFELEKILKKRVDLLTYDSIHHLLKKYILEGQKVILK